MQCERSGDPVGVERYFVEIEQTERALLLVFAKGPVVGKLSVERKYVLDDVRSETYGRRDENIDWEA